MSWQKVNRIRFRRNIIVRFLVNLFIPFHVEAELRSFYVRPAVNVSILRFRVVIPNLLYWSRLHRVYDRLFTEPQRKRVAVDRATVTDYDCCSTLSHITVNL